MLQRAAVLLVVVLTIFVPDAHATSLPPVIDSALTLQPAGDVTEPRCWVPCRVQATTPATASGYQPYWSVYEPDVGPPDPPLPWTQLRTPVIDVVIPVPARYVMTLSAMRPDGRYVHSPSSLQFEVAHHPLDLGSATPAIVRTLADGRPRPASLPGTIAARSAKTNLVAEVRRGDRWVRLNRAACGSADRKAARCFAVRRVADWPASTARSVQVRLTDWEHDRTRAKRRTISLPLAS